MSAERTVRGSVVLADPLPAPGGLLIVRVEDVSRADDAARLVGTFLQEIAGPRAQGDSIDFSVQLAEVDPALHYQVRAHLSMQNRDEIATGDLLSTVATPVLTFGHSGPVEVPVRRI